MSTTYQVPEATKVRHIHLKVSDIHRSLSFYRDLLGFQVMAWYDEQAVFLSAGGYHHHIGRGSRLSIYVDRLFIFRLMVTSMDY